MVKKNIRYWLVYEDNERDKRGMLKYGMPVAPIDAKTNKEAQEIAERGVTIRGKHRKPKFLRKTTHETIKAW